MSVVERVSRVERAARADAADREHGELAVLDPAGREAGWVDVCGLDDLLPDRGAAALVGDAPIAVFRCSPDDRLFAIGNTDPFSNASVLSRGIVGSVADRHVIASPIYKHRFDLATGQSLDDPSVAVATFAVRHEGGRVLVQAHEPDLNPSPRNQRETGA